MEIFKTISEFPKYQISNFGNVKNGRGELMIVGKRKANSGYLQVRLYGDGKYYYRYIHRLVALAFIDNPNGYRTVNHKDGNKTNNNVSNLEWASDEQQQRHAFMCGLKGNGQALSNNEVFRIYDMFFVKKMKPKQISEILKRPFGTIRKICYGERCKGLLREYRDKHKM